MTQQQPKRIGEFLHVSKTGRPVYRLQAEARIGQPVFNAQGKRVGDVFDIFGPVTAPYASIKLRDDQNEAPSDLYLGERTERRPRDTKRRRRR